MTNPPCKPDTINALQYGVDHALAMLAGMQLDVFSPLQHGPMTTEQIADAIGVAPTRLPLLLYALVAAGLLTEQDGQFANTDEAQHFLVKGQPAYMGKMQNMLAHQWKIRLQTAESLQTGVPQARVDFTQSSQDELEVYLRRLHSQDTGEAAPTLVEHYDFSSATTLVDIGGGAGGLTIAFAKVCPHLRATVVDLPQVTPITEKIVAEEGIADRITILAADVVNHPLPGSYDVAVMQNFTQVLSPNDVLRAIQHIGAAINPGGAIYIIGHVLDDSRTFPPIALGFNLTCINQYDVGEAYPEQTYRDWLSAAGFVDIERASFTLSGGRSLMTARKP